MPSLCFIIVPTFFHHIFPLFFPFLFFLPHFPFLPFHSTAQHNTDEFRVSANSVGEKEQWCASAEELEAAGDLVDLADVAGADGKHRLAASRDLRASCVDHDVVRDVQPLCLLCQCLPVRACAQSS